MLKVGAWRAIALKAKNGESGYIGVAKCSGEMIAACTHLHEDERDAVNCALDLISVQTGSDQSWRKYPR